MVKAKWVPMQPWRPVPRTAEQMGVQRSSITPILRVSKFTQNISPKYSVLSSDATSAIYMNPDRQWRFTRSDTWKQKLMQVVFLPEHMLCSEDTQLLILLSAVLSNAGKLWVHRHLYVLPTWQSMFSVHRFICKWSICIPFPEFV